MLTIFLILNFFSYIASFFIKKEEVTKAGWFPSKVHKESAIDEPKIRESQGNSKISEWIKPDEPEVKEDSNKNII